FDAHSQARLRSIQHAQSQALQWGEDEIIGPDVESRDTLLELAKMTNNAYVDSEDPYWYDLEGKWSEVRYLFDYYQISPAQLILSSMPRNTYGLIVVIT